jgi:hypothetical protein
MNLKTVIEAVVTKGYRRVKTTSGLGTTNDRQVTPYGFDSVPLIGEKAIRHKTTKEPILTGYIQAAIDGLQPGESVVFSRAENGDLAATITSRQDATVELLGTGDYLTRFNELKTEFNELKGKVNDLVQGFNAHVHASSGTPPTATPPLIPASQSTANIDNAKHESLKTNEKP